MYKMPSNAKLGIACVLVLLIVTTGCKSGNQANRQSPPDSPLNISEGSELHRKEAIVLAAVKRYYAEKGWSTPERIVITKRKKNVWSVHAGPEIKEATLEIDPNTGQVRRFFPGY